MHRVTDVADLVRLVRLETVLRIAVLVRINGHGSDAQFVGGTKGPDRDLPAIGDEHLGKHVWLPYPDVSDQRRPIVPKADHDQQEYCREPERGQRPSPLIEQPCPDALLASPVFPHRTENDGRDHHQQCGDDRPDHHAVWAQGTDTVQALEYQPMHERHTNQDPDRQADPIPPGQRHFRHRQHPGDHHHGEARNAEKRVGKAQQRRLRCGHHRAARHYRVDIA